MGESNHWERGKAFLSTVHNLESAESEWFSEMDSEVKEKHFKKVQTCQIQQS